MAAAALPVLSAERLAKLEECVRLIDADRAPASASAWRLEGEVAPGVLVESCAVAGLSLRKFRARGSLPAPPAAVAPLLWQRERRLAWDASYAGIDELVPRFGGLPASDDAGLVRLSLKPVLVVSARDFVNVQLMRDRSASDGSFLSVSYSVTDDACPPHPDFVRGDVLPGSAWHLAPGEDGNSCVLTYVILTDIKGWVPAFAVNAAVSKTFESYFVTLRSVLATHPPT